MSVEGTAGYFFSRCGYGAVRMTLPIISSPQGARPLIGLSCGTLPQPDWSALAIGHFQDYVFREYSRGLEAAGGVPVLIPVLQDPAVAASALDRLDGLLLTGGEDVCPHLFRQEPKQGLQDTDEERDRLELALIRRADELDLPVFGICRGIQLLNTAYGGSLFQDIYREVPDCLNHNQKASKAFNSHKIRLSSGSRLAAIMGADEIWVNSNHHQAIMDPAPILTPVATASDGIIEAVERPGNRFVLAVQWHPEGNWHRDEYAMKLFQAFVSAASDYRNVNAYRR
jgi:putative glutamine amidotransferase